MLSTVVVAIGLFAGTNIDDIIIVTLFFLAAQRRVLQTWQVVVGQFIGVSVLIGLSLLAALGLTIVPDRWVGLLGVLPLSLGVWGFIAYVSHRRNRQHLSDDDDGGSALNPGGLLGVIGITLANGGDNIAVYTPLFRTMTTPDTIVTIVVFVALIGVWLLVGYAIGSRPRVLRAISGVERWLVPTVYCTLGLVILAESDAIAALFSR